MQALSLEEEARNKGENHQRDDFLNHLQLHKREGSAIGVIADTVGRYGEAVLNKSDAPRERDDRDEGPVGTDARLLQAQVAVPGQRHEDVACEQK